MRDLGTLITPAIDIAQIGRRVRDAHAALQAAEQEEKRTAEAAEAAREEAGRRRLELGRMLMRARTAWPARGPRAKGWGDFLRDQGIEERSARNWMALAGYAEEISETDADVSEIPARVPTLAEAGIDKRPRQGAERAAPLVHCNLAGDTSARTPHVAHNSGNNEWYTPPDYIEAARSVLGTIDLDPASSRQANAVVGATAYYSIDDDGLTRPWRGRVWMNPPYSSDLVGRFADKLAAHFDAGEISAAIVLVNNATETAWFGTLVERASAIVFPLARVRFRDPDGRPGSPLQGQAILYFGNYPDEFLARFEEFGWGVLVHRACVDRRERRVG